MNVVDALLDRVPAFAAARSNNSGAMSESDDLPYLVFGDFAFFISDTIRNDPNPLVTCSPLKEAFEFLNEMAGSGDPELENLAAVGVFEILTYHNETKQFASKHLTGRALELFDTYCVRS